jgi:hypothetical protein
MTLPLTMSLREIDKASRLDAFSNMRGSRWLR